MIKATGMQAVLASSLLVLAGCGGLQEIWEGPGAESFHPKTIAVLPPMVGPYEGARDSVQQILVSSLAKRARYERIANPEQVTAAFSNREASDLLSAYYSKLETTGQSDAEMAVKLGKLLQAEALLIPKVNSWEYGRAEGDNFAKVALGLRLIDARSGGAVWKARHDRVKTYMIFKPALKDVATDLTEEMLKYLPK